MEELTHNENSQRVVTLLTREEIDFLDKLGKDALFSTGTKLSRAKLLAWLVDTAQGCHLDGIGLTSKTEFQKKLLEEIRKTSEPEKH
jgi:hypothetical protein